MDQSAAEEVLKQQLAVYAEDFAMEKRDRERLQGEVKRAHGKVQALEQEVIHCFHKCFNPILCFRFIYLVYM